MAMETDERQEAKRKAVAERAWLLLQEIRKRDEDLPDLETLEEGADIKELEERSSALRAEAAQAIEEAQRRQQSVESGIHRLQGAGQAFQEVIHQLISSAAIAADRARTEAEEAPTISELEAASGTSARILSVAESILRSPITDDTRRNQSRLLIASIIALLLGSGLASIEKLTLGGAEVKIDTRQLVWLVVAALLACWYCVVGFVVSYRRDVSVNTMTSAHAAALIRPLLKWLVIERSALYEVQLAALAAMQENATKRPSAEFLNISLDRIYRRQRGLGILEEGIIMINAAMTRARSLSYARKWSDLLLPLTVAAVASGLCLRFVVVVLLQFVAA